MLTVLEGHNSTVFPQTRRLHVRLWSAEIGQVAGEWMGWLVVGFGVSERTRAESSGATAGMYLAGVSVPHTHSPVVAARQHAPAVASDRHRVDAIPCPVSVCSTYPPTHTPHVTTEQPISCGGSPQSCQNSHLARCSTHEQGGPCCQSPARRPRTPHNLRVALHGLNHLHRLTSLNINIDFHHQRQ